MTLRLLGRSLTQPTTPLTDSPDSLASSSSSTLTKTPPQEQQQQLQRLELRPSVLAPTLLEESPSYGQSEYLDRIPSSLFFPLATGGHGTVVPSVGQLNNPFLPIGINGPATFLPSFPLAPLPTQPPSAVAAASTFPHSAMGLSPRVRSRSLLTRDDSLVAPRAVYMGRRSSVRSLDVSAPGERGGRGGDRSGRAGSEEEDGESEGVLGQRFRLSRKRCLVLFGILLIALALAVFVIVANLVTRPDSQQAERRFLTGFVRTTVGEDPEEQHSPTEVSLTGHSVLVGPDGSPVFAAVRHPDQVLILGSCPDLLCVTPSLREFAISVPKLSETGALTAQRTAQPPMISAGATGAHTRERGQAGWDDKREDEETPILPLLTAADLAHTGWDAQSLPRDAGGARLGLGRDTDSMPMTDMLLAQSGELLLAFTTMDGAMRVLLCPTHKCTADARPALLARDVVPGSFSAVLPPNSAPLFLFADATSALRLVNCDSLPCRSPRHWVLPALRMRQHSRSRMRLSADGLPVFALLGEWVAQKLFSMSFITNLMDAALSAAVFGVLIEARVLILEPSGAHVTPDLAATTVAALTPVLQDLLEPVVNWQELVGQISRILNLARGPGPAISSAARPVSAPNASNASNASDASNRALAPLQRGGAAAPLSFRHALSLAQPRASRRAVHGPRPPLRAQPGATVRTTDSAADSAELCAELASRGALLSSSLCRSTQRFVAAPTSSPALSPLGSAAHVPIRVDRAYFAAQRQRPSSPLVAQPLLSAASGALPLSTAPPSPPPPPAESANQATKYGPLVVVCEARPCAPWNLVVTAPGSLEALDFDFVIDQRGAPLFAFLTRSTPTSTTRDLVVMTCATATCAAKDGLPSGGGVQRTVAEGIVSATDHISLVLSPRLDAPPLVLTNQRGAPVVLPCLDALCSQLLEPTWPAPATTLCNSGRCHAATLATMDSQPFLFLGSIVPTLVHCSTGRCQPFA